MFSKLYNEAIITFNMETTSPLFIKAMKTAPLIQLQQTIPTWPFIRMANRYR